uniref:Uncharacterized protein n=1 Tax=Aegilops tauschii subsp. strangulata TaxID=200361 RepID=A0A453MFX1_AEGTS
GLAFHRTHEGRTAQAEPDDSPRPRASAGRRAPHGLHRRCRAPTRRSAWCRRRQRTPVLRETERALRLSALLLRERDGVRRTLGTS